MLGKSDRKSPRNGNSAIETLVGPHATIRGDISFDGGLYVEGRIFGKVIAEEGADAVLTIAEEGAIEGEVRAPVVVISGRMNGDVHAYERVQLTAKARVTGNIHYKVVEMAAGATVTGRLIHGDAVVTEELPAGATPIRRGKAEAQDA
ncbi:MAG TPA: polymer-forming cytoskeletal protein [Arenimonas sp.]|jgi:cytoskeletal protein CcmA (bactofilin family)|nr:polymer-forming cytoskeletal protein [Arenimonas sp.]